MNILMRLKISSEQNVSTQIKAFPKLLIFTDVGLLSGGLQAPSLYSSIKILSKSSTPFHFHRIAISFYSNIMVYCPELVEDFETLANNLAPSQAYLKAGRTAANSIFKWLTSNSHNHNFSIGRLRIAGSVGKGTCISYQDKNGNIINSDFDCVVFVNNQEPPFDEILENFEAVLDQHSRVERVAKGRTHLQFTYKTHIGLIKFDLLPAPNYVTSTTPGQDVGGLQTEVALLLLRTKQLLSLSNDNEVCKHENKLYSSSLAEKRVSFVREHVSNDFVRKVVCLAKYWNCNIDFKNEYISGRSYMMEVISIYAQRGRKNKRCVVTGFQRFLQIMAKLNELALSFNGKIHPTFKTIRPLIIDPANPFNNLAGELSKSVIRVFSAHAKQTLGLLQNLKRASDYENVENAIDEIFRHKL